MGSFCIAGFVQKSLGKARVDGSGNATVKFQVPGDRPTPLDVVVSPLSELSDVKRIKLETATVTKWAKHGETWVAEAMIELSPAFFTAVSWLDE